MATSESDGASSPQETSCSEMEEACTSSSFLDSQRLEIAQLTASLEMLCSSTDSRRASRCATRRKSRKVKFALSQGSQEMSAEKERKAQPRRKSIVGKTGPRKSVRGLAQSASVGRRRSSFKTFTNPLMQGMTREMIPAVRDHMHNLRKFGMGWKEQANALKSCWFSKVVADLDIPEPDKAIKETTTAARLKHEQRRHWTEALAAVHRPHAPEEDPLIHTSHPSSSSSSVAATPRGFLEVEVLAFGAEPALKCADGAEAINPVCQLMFGGRCTGGLQPWASGGGIEEGRSEDGRPCSPNRACFEVHEVAGSDLRLHVFDVASPRFAMGLEESAFCGGALVPLSVLHYHRRECRSERPLRHACEAKVGVRLLPLDFLAAGKLSMQQSSLKSRECAKVGVVLLRLRFHSHSHSVPGMLAAIPFRGIPRSHVEAARVDQPMSIIVSVAKSLERLGSAFDFKAYLTAADAVRDSAVSCLALLLIWSYVSLLAPLWQLPWCVLLAWLLLVREVAIAAREAREADPPTLLQQEDDSDNWNMIEQSKKGLKKAVSLQLVLVDFARTCNGLARNLERVSHIASLRDPVLAQTCGLVLLCSTTATSLSIWGLSLVPRQMGVPLVIWMSGVAVLLPRAYQEKIFFSLVSLYNLKEQVLGPHRVIPSLQAFYSRVPDRDEALHWELFEQCVLLP